MEKLNKQIATLELIRVIRIFKMEKLNKQPSYLKLIKIIRIFNLITPKIIKKPSNLEQLHLACQIHQ
jgi:hypothetical protein